MFIRKRVRHLASGPRVYFTALRSVRTPAGPRQQTVVSWSSSTDPASLLYRPSVEAALALIETDSFACTSTATLRARAEGYRETLRNTNGGICLVPSIRGVLRVKREEIERRAQYFEDSAKEREQQAEGLRAVLAEIGNWTWDGQL